MSIGESNGDRGQDKDNHHYPMYRDNDNANHADSRMRRILLVLPDDWTIEKIRYLQAPTGGQAFLLDMDLIDSPIDNPESLFNYASFTLKEDGPTGYKVYNVEID